MNTTEWNRHTQAMKEITYYCKCGGKLIIPHKVTKGICRSCRNYVFKDLEDEKEYRKKAFKTKLLEMLAK